MVFQVLLLKMNTKNKNYIDYKLANIIASFSLVKKFREVIILIIFYATFSRHICYNIKNAFNKCVLSILEKDRVSIILV